MVGQKPNQKQEENDYKLIRILSTDIPGNIKIYAGLTRIKGISWSIANAICLKLKIPKIKKISELTEGEIEKINSLAKKLETPKIILNRRSDMDSGNDKHLVGTELELQKEFDIKRLKKIKSYRGFRHQHGQPSRGQRTKAHFRTNRKKGVGIKKKNSLTQNVPQNRGAQR